MKTVIIFLAIVGLTLGEEVEISGYSLSSVGVAAIENIRDEMPCGFPDLGIPPLAPLEIAQKDVDINTDFLQLKGVVNNFRLIGLNDFEIDEFKINAITSKVVFRFIFNNVNVDTQYDLDLFLKKSGFTINLLGNGPAKLAIKQMSISGTIKYSFGIISQKLKLKTMNIRTKIGEVESNIEGVLGQGGINEKFNDILEDAVQVAINDNEEEIANAIESRALPMVNDALSRMNIGDLIGGGGGSGGGESGEPKPKCNA